MFATSSSISRRCSQPFTLMKMPESAGNAAACTREESRRRDGPRSRHKGGGDEIRHLLRAAAATPVGAERRIAPLPECARPGRIGRRLGYDFPWEVEHHFLEEYSHSPAPEVFPGAASQRTGQIRLAHGIIQLTTSYPARVAERIAVLDLLSRDRVEFGMGESASVTELEPFGRGFAEKRAVWEESVRATIPMFADGGYEYHGPYFDFPLPTSCPSRCRSRICRCGARARSWRPSRWP
jgi:alkanesulfonate monooxygenase SsuD/methylene tetrahydromethanopterin reductase-like flavin-dependent oxidoreductase (luciferase family)